MSAPAAAAYRRAADVSTACAISTNAFALSSLDMKPIKPGVDFEALLAFQMRCAGLPDPETQIKVVPARKFPWDFGWPAYRLLVEVQGGIWRKGGGAHSHPSNIMRDVEKQQLAVIHGWYVFPVTTDEVSNGQALQLITLALKSKGWKP